MNKIWSLFSKSKPSTPTGVSKVAEAKRIPLSIGFANFVGEEFAADVMDDARILSPLFSSSLQPPAHQIPNSPVLFVYAKLNDDGTIQGIASAGIRQVVQMTGSALVVLATPNSPESIKNASLLPGPKTANIVFTIDRNGSGFSKFFHELFLKMQDGKPMLAAWVEICPQGPQSNPSYAPKTILSAEGGNIAFPS